MNVKEKIADFRTGDLININEVKELQYWSEKYNVSVDIIREAVNKVGPEVKKVEAKLRRRK